ncbi:MAG: hypothetical protein Q8P60_13430 [Pseudorhodobacter sp.]|nr:hypothetical protein [Pseudorhodobacter sp.]
MPPDRPGPTLQFDPTRLRQLLDGADPETARQLLDSLQSDLGTVHCILVQGCAAADCEAISAQTHVLTGLAGTVGALRLQWAAEALYLGAQQCNIAALAPLGQDVLALLAELRLIIGQWGQTACQTP